MQYFDGKKLSFTIGLAFHIKSLSLFGFYCTDFCYFAWIFKLIVRKQMDDQETEIPIWKRTQALYVILFNVMNALPADWLFNSIADIIQVSL